MKKLILMGLFICSTAYAENWKGDVQNVTPSDSVISVDVLYTSESGKTVTKNYQVTSGSVADVADFQNLIAKEITNLEKFDTLTNGIKALNSKQIKVDTASQITITDSKDTL